MPKLPKISPPKPPLPPSMQAPPKKAGSKNPPLKPHEQAIEGGTHAIGWIDERTSLSGGARWMMFRKVPKGTNWFYTLGSATMFAFLSQAGIADADPTQAVRAEHRTDQCAPHAEQARLVGRLAAYRVVRSEASGLEALLLDVREEHVRRDDLRDADRDVRILRSQLIDHRGEIRQRIASIRTCVMRKNRSSIYCVFRGAAC